MKVLKNRVIECLKQITVKDVEYWIAKAKHGKKLNQRLYRNHNGRLWHQSSHKNETSDDESLISLAQRFPVSETFASKDIDE